MQPETELSKSLMRFGSFLSKVNQVPSGEWGNSLHFQMESTSYPGATIRRLQDAGVLGNSFSDNWIYALDPKTSGGSIEKIYQPADLLTTMYSIVLGSLRENFLSRRPSQAGEDDSENDNASTKGSPFLWTLGTAGELIRPTDDGVVEFQAFLNKANVDLQAVIKETATCSLFGWAFVNDLSEYRKRSLFIKDRFDIFYLELVEWFPSY